MFVCVFVGTTQPISYTKTKKKKKKKKIQEYKVHARVSEYWYVNVGRQSRAEQARQALLSVRLATKIFARFDMKISSQCNNQTELNSTLSFFGI